MNATVDQYVLFTDPLPAVSRVMAHKGYPLQMGWLEKALMLIDKSNTNKPLTPHTDQDTEVAMIRLGVGNSMIPSLRYWSHAAGVVETVNEIERPTEFARTLTKVDPYFEEIGSLWLIHWNISTQSEVSVHSWFFNRFFKRSFSKNDLVDAFFRYTHKQNLRTSQNQAGRDIDCFLKNYCSPSGQQQDEPFSMIILRELGLMHSTRKKPEETYVVDTGSQQSLPTAVFAIALIEFWNRYFNNQKTMPFDNLLTGHGSPGLVFRLSQAALCERIESVEMMLDNKLCWSNTQGLRQLQCNDIGSLYANRYHLLSHEGCP